MQPLRLFLVLFFCSFAPLVAQPAAAPASADTKAAQTAPANNDAPANAAAPSGNKAAEEQARLNNNAAAATVQQQAHHPANNAATSFLEHLVDSILLRFDVSASGNTTARYLIAAGFIVAAIVLRRLVLMIVFGIARRFSARTKTTLDDKLFTAVEAPISVIIVIAGIVAALKVLKLSPSTDDVVNQAATMAFSLGVFWLLLRAFSTVLDHTGELAREKKMGIAAFMPWIKKSLITVFIIFGILMVAQSQGLNVKAFLAGLGIGGLAFALAAQDTLANVFGSVVVAIDQPFKIGEFVQIGGNSGAVEDIGLRSTKLRRADKSLIVIPNKTVAAEAITNLARFTQRRMEQNIGITYDATPEQMEALVEEIRSLILAQPEIDKASVMVNFSDFSASSLNIWIVYMTLTPDFGQFIKVRQRLNLAFMNAVAARKMAFAFPSQTVYLEGEVARKLVDKPVA